jgi:hypothetical protein
MRGYKHGGTGTRLHKVWITMKQRCSNPNGDEYHRYGGRGIRVCEEWLSFANFRDWAMANGYNPNAPRGTCTLDRIDNDGNYEPSNCRWVDMREQMKNRPKRGLFYEYNGESHTLYDWAKIMGTSHSLLRNRIRWGWDIEQALTAPVRGKN